MTSLSFLDGRGVTLNDRRGRALRRVALRAARARGVSLAIRPTWPAGVVLSMVIVPPAPDTSDDGTGAPVVRAERRAGHVTEWTGPAGRSRWETHSGGGNP